MQIQVVLHAVLREKLPPQARGRAVLTLPEGAALSDVLAQLNLDRHITCAVNGRVQRDLSAPLRDGDEVHCFRAAGGGCLSA